MFPTLRVIHCFLVFILSSSKELSAEEPVSVAAEVSDAITKVYPALVSIRVVMEEGSQGRMKKMQDILLHYRCKRSP